eukprot:TRINITY_DN4595_c0_g2_i5.p1 TRINITY_DN4595_c0_g2~~TRINITY_DN4595_c0_g2_i5.p1  ORF type:complete len:302 (-),score=48.94 TRINITY_DN4595_c0_g2_i5:159-1064(-)
MDTLTRDFLTSLPMWQRNNGSNFVISTIHPLALHQAWPWLSTAHFLMVDFCTPRVEHMTLDKDVVTPYVSIRDWLSLDDWKGYKERHVLLSFMGLVYKQGMGKLRLRLQEVLTGEEGVQFHEGRFNRNAFGLGTEFFFTSKFCLVPAGDTPTSSRLFDSIVSGCIPIVVSDDIELPFEEFIDYTQFAIFVPQAFALKKGYLLSFLRQISKSKWRRRQNMMKKVAPAFKFSTSPDPSVAVEYMWKTLHQRHHDRMSNKQMTSGSRSRNRLRRKKMLEEFKRAVGVQDVPVLMCAHNNDLPQE